MKLLEPRFIFKYLLPAFLIVIALVGIFRLLKSAEFGILTLDVQGTRTQLESNNSTGSGELLKGDIITGKFHSAYPNLSIVTVRFNNFNRDSDDVLIFRIKMEGDQNWFYQANYKTDQFLPHKHFPFGFPVIHNSAGKDFVFQLESTRGVTGKGIAIDYFQNPIFVGKSIYTKSELLGNWKNLFSFILNKTNNIFRDPEISSYIISYFLPLILFYLFITSEGISYQFLTILCIGISFYDIFGIKNDYIYLWLSVTLLWLLTSIRFKFESRISSMISTLFFLMTPILIISNQESFAEKTAIWALLYLSISAIQELNEYRRHLRYKSEATLINNIFPGARETRKISIRIIDDQTHSLFHTTNTFTLSKFFKYVTSIEMDLRRPLARMLYYLYKPFSLLLIFFFVFKIYSRLLETFNLYKEFYTENISFRFWSNTLAPELLAISVIVIFYLLIRKKFVNRYLICVFLAFVSLLVTSTVIARTTAFRYVPKIISVSPQETSEAWTDIIINGKNFRDKPFVGEVYIDGSKQGILTEWSDDKVIFRTNPQETKSGNLYIKPVDRQATNQVPFSYTYK